MKAKLLITLLIVLFVKVGIGQTWIYLTSSASGTEYYCRSSPASKSNTIKIWIKTVGNISYRYDDKVIKVPGGYEKNLIEFDCNGLRYKIIATHTYDSLGEVVNSFNYEQVLELKWFDIIPDSVFDGVIAQVCERFN